MATITNNLSVITGASSGGGGAAGSFSETLWTDDSNVYYCRLDTAGVITWKTITGGASGAPGTGARPSSGVNVLLSRSSYQATAGGTGYSINDYIDHFVTTDPATGVIAGNFWLNITTAAVITAPSTANISPVS